MLKMPEEMTPEELEQFERWMFEADEQCTKRKKEASWRQEDIKDSMARIMFEG